jgi:hypothetical protein
MLVNTLEVIMTIRRLQLPPNASILTLTQHGTPSRNRIYLRIFMGYGV